MSNSGPEIAYHFMCEVKEGLKTKNRFVCNPRMDKLIEMYASDSLHTFMLKAGTCLFRARKYKESDAVERYCILPHGRFKGYGEKDSFVNPNFDLVSEGRCNPSYIPYLYTAKSEICTIYEIRPAKEDYLSIARIKVISDLKILDLSCYVHWADNSVEILPGVSNGVLFSYCVAEFSRPSKNPGDYLLCQYISEKVKLMGFDGIAYNSAVYVPKKRRKNSHTNQNIVVFNYRKCKAVSSWMRKVEEVDILYK